LESSIHILKRLGNILGSEFAREVEAVEKGGNRFRKGDQSLGAYAESSTKELFCGEPFFYSGPAIY
jgi:NADPH:quinone reductase-like Zn-dependent oxidoreductase